MDKYPNNDSKGTNRTSHMKKDDYQEPSDCETSNQIEEECRSVSYDEENLPALTASIQTLSVNNFGSSSLPLEIEHNSEKDASNSLIGCREYGIINSSIEPNSVNNHSTGAISKKSKPFPIMHNPLFNNDSDNTRYLKPLKTVTDHSSDVDISEMTFPSQSEKDNAIQNLSSNQLRSQLLPQSRNIQIDSNLAASTGAIRKSLHSASVNYTINQSGPLKKKNEYTLDSEQILLEPMNRNTLNNYDDNHSLYISPGKNCGSNETANIGNVLSDLAFSVAHIAKHQSSSKITTGDSSNNNNQGASASSSFRISEITNEFAPAVLNSQPCLPNATNKISNQIRTDNQPSNNTEKGSPHLRPPIHCPIGGPVYNWQATLTSVKERFAFLFNNEILSDVQFVVGRGEEEQTIPAHKFVLAVGSAVFDAMFNGLLAEQQVIHLPDVEPQAFLTLLSFLYSDEVQIGPETVMTVLYTAKKYAVPALERRCVDFLKTNLSPDNAFMLLTQARLFDEPQLAAMCLKTIDKCTAEAIVAEGFSDIDYDTLMLVLQRDTLRIKELHLYHAVCRWAEAECARQGFGVSGRQQRAVLGQALKLIRFPLMTVEEFAQGPAQSNILTDSEVVQLFLYFSVNPKPSVDFIDVPRCCMTGKEQSVNRFQSIEARWGYSGTPDRIRFVVDRRIFVVGFGIYGSIHGPSEYEVTVQLIHTLTGKVCGSNETVFTSDGTPNTFRVMFPDPIEVLPNTNYTAYVTLRGPDSHYGTKGLRKVIVECPSGDRVSFQFSYAAGNNNGTSVEDGQIPEIIFYT